MRIPADPEFSIGNILVHQLQCERELNRKEEDYYAPILEEFRGLFESKGRKAHLEVTANRQFSNNLKSKIPDGRHIIFYFLRDVAPDITGFVSRDNWVDFVIIEVKNEQIKLDHIYQARKYAELFDTKFAFLISTEEIPDEIKRLSKVAYPLLSIPANRQLTLVHYAEKVESLEDWYPENPFEKEYHWK